MKDCLNVLLVAITELINYSFDNACCPSVWNTSYLLTRYKGKGDTSDPNSARGIALQSLMLNAYCYILDRRMYRWAEWSEVCPGEQHGFMVNRSTETAQLYVYYRISSASIYPSTSIRSLVINCNGIALRKQNWKV